MTVFRENRSVLPRKAEAIWRSNEREGFERCGWWARTAGQFTDSGKMQVAIVQESWLETLYAGNCQFGTFLFTGRLIKVIDRTMRKKMSVKLNKCNRKPNERNRAGEARQVA